MGLFVIKRLRKNFSKDKCFYWRVSFFRISTLNPNIDIFFFISNYPILQQNAVCRTNPPPANFATLHRAHSTHLPYTHPIHYGPYTFGCRDNIRSFTYLWPTTIHCHNVWTNLLTLYVFQIKKILFFIVSA